MPTRSQAIEILVSSRARTEALLEALTDTQLRAITKLGGGSWSAKDLLGHLAGYEEYAASLATGGAAPKHMRGFDSVDQRNDADIERKRKWSMNRVRADLSRAHESLLDAIRSMDDEHWSTKVSTGTGRSALGLVLGRILVGGTHGLFAHDLAHLKDLERSVKTLRE
jgi:uncharacterized protein (TIGR03083 family)